MIAAILKDLIVIELANVLAGPSVGMFLAEAGATVIKVENINGGDVTRSWKLASEDAVSDISAYFSATNWGKKSIAVDLKNEKGKAIIYSLISKADAVICSYKPGDAEKLKVDYKQLSSINPQIIYAQLTGYGSTDPRTGYDGIIQAEAGFMSINGTPDSGPVKMPVAFMDILAAHQLKEAILIALIKKYKTGKGSFIESSLIETGIASLANQATNWLNGGEIPARIGSAHPNIMPYGNIYKAKDGKEIILAVGNDAQFEKLLEALNLSHIEKGRFDTNEKRVKNRKALDEILVDAISTKTGDKLLEQLKQMSIPAGAVLNVKEVFESGTGDNLFLNKKGWKGVRSVSFNLEKIDLSPPPHFGEHTEEILSSFLQYSEKEMASLKSEKVIHANANS